MLRILCLIVAWLSAALGTAGIFLPLLPTVPLYLLAALCFAKGSRRLHDWFVATRLYREHIDGYVKAGGLTWKIKMRIMVIVSAQLFFAIFFMQHVLIASAALTILWLALMLFFAFGIKTIEEKDKPGGI